jgi:hypothetical protein
MQNWGIPMRRTGSEDLAVLARHLARLIDETGDVTTAAEKLRASSPADLHPQLEGVVALVTSAGASDAKPKGPLVGLLKVLTSIGDDAAARGRAVAAFERNRSSTGSAVRVMVSDATAISSYLITLCVIGAVVSWIAVTFVLPQFAEMFSNFGAELPTLTRMVLTGGGYGAYLVAIVLLSMAAFVWFFISTLKRSLSTFTPMPRSWHRVPGFSGLAQQFDFMLFLVFAQVLRAARADPAAAVSGAKELVGTDSTSAHDHPSANWLSLAIAESTGSLGEELDRMLSDEVPVIHANFAANLRTLIGWLKALVFTLIGLLVISLYLPIFKMGSVV